MAEELERNTAASAPRALTRRVLVEIFNLRYIKKNAIALYESNMTTQEEIDELGVYSGLLIPYLTKRENDAFHNRIIDVWYTIYHNSKEYKEHCETEEAQRVEDEKNGLIKPIQQRPVRYDENHELLF